MESTTPISAQQENEISLKELFLKIQKLFTYLLEKWLIILPFAAIGAGAGLLYALTKEKLYIAELTFVLEDNKSNALGAYTGLADQFGLDLGAGSSNGVFSGDNILEFLKSRLMVEKVLLSPVVDQGKQQSLADYYIEMNDLRKSWGSNHTLKELHFPINPDRTGFTLQQDSILNTIYISIVNGNLEIAKPDKKLSFISVACSTKDEIFSKAFTECLVKKAIDFYIQTKTQRFQVTINNLQARADSLESLLNRKTYSAAASQDMNLNPVRSISGVSTELIQRDKVVLQTMYAEVIKNLELGKMAMAQETPIIQIVDTPILPLKEQKFGKLKGIVIGGLLGGLLTTLILVLILIYRRIMA